MNTGDMETVGIEPTEGSRHTATDPRSPLIGSLGNSSDGMVHMMLSRNRSGGDGVRLSLSHDGWNGHASLDGHSVARLEQLCAIALEALGERGYDVEKLRASAKYHGDDYIREGLVARPPAVNGEDAA